MGEDVRIALFLLICLVVPASAHAYIDPGTGSFIIQGIIAAIVGAGVAVKLSWKRIKARLTGRGDEQDDDLDA